MQEEVKKDFLVYHRVANGNTSYYSRNKKSELYQTGKLVQLVGASNQDMVLNEMRFCLLPYSNYDKVSVIVL